MSDKSEEPIIDLPKKQSELQNLILDNPEAAWVSLQEDPAMVLALTQVKRNFEEGNAQDNDNSKNFFEQYHKQVKKIFVTEDPLDRFGIALTTEFLTEYWRKSVGSTKMTSVNQAISEKMNLLREATEALPDSYIKTVTSKIVDYSSKRVHEFSNYNISKARDHLFNIRPEIDDFVANFISDGVSPQVLSLAYFATAPVESVEILRNYIAKSLMLQLRAKFDEFDEETKYKIAPYISVFEKISKSSSDEPSESTK